MFLMHMNIMIAHGSKNNRDSNFPALGVPPSEPPKTRTAPTMATAQTASPLHPLSQLPAAGEPEDPVVRFSFGSIVSTPSGCNIVLPMIGRSRGHFPIFDLLIRLRCLATHWRSWQNQPRAT